MILYGINININNININIIIFFCNILDDQNTQFNEYFEIFSSRESINDSSDIEVGDLNNDSSDIKVGDLNTVHCNDDCKNLKTAKNNQTVLDCYNSSNEQMSHNPSHSNVSSRDDIDNQNLSDKDWFYKQSKQSSIESFESNDEIGQQQDIPDGFYRFISQIVVFNIFPITPDFLNVGKLNGNGIGFTKHTLINK